MEAFGDPSERAWVAGKAIVMFEGRHQFEELPVLRRRGKQKEKGYRHKVKKQNKIHTYTKEQKPLKLSSGGSAERRQGRRMLFLKYKLMDICEKIGRKQGFFVGMRWD